MRSFVAPLKVGVLSVPFGQKVTLTVDRSGGGHPSGPQVLLHNQMTSYNAKPFCDALSSFAHNQGNSTELESSHSVTSSYVEQW